MRITTGALLFPLIFFPVTAYSVEFTLFGDVVYDVTKSEDEADQDTNSFKLGQFDLITLQDIGEDTTVSAEVVFEDTGHGFEVDVERFSVSKTFNPLFVLGLGRFHTHLGIWNQSFHHGTLIQDTITRPFFLEFEDSHGGIFPNHLIGMVISGDTGKTGYQFGYGNNNGINTTEAESDPGNAELGVINTNDPSTEKAIATRLFYKPGSFIDEMGVSFMLNQVVELGDDHGTGQPFLHYGEVLFEQKIIALDFRYNGDKFSSIFELFHTTIDDNQTINAGNAGATILPNPKPYESLSYYLQIGYHVTEKLSLIGRFESLDVDENATYFELLGTVPTERTVFAVNYKLQESNALRFEFSRADDPEGNGENAITNLGVQWFFILF